MNFNEAKEYLYNRYKNNFNVSTDNVNFLSNGFCAMSFEEYGLYIYSFSVLENGQPVWSSNVNDLTIKKAQDGLKSGEFTSLDLVESYIKEIESKNKEINAYLEIFEDAREQAKFADEMIAKGESKTLTGIPLAIKDA